MADSNYDYIILGAGASGLMLAYRMAKDSYFDSKSILIIDKELEKGNDRTWCYWEKGTGEWDSLLRKEWNTIYFGSHDYAQRIDLGSYSYKMIRSGKFYDHLWQTINQKSNFSFIQAEVKAIKEGEVEVQTTDNTYSGKKVFDSLAKPSVYSEQEQYPVLKQHFVGWFVKTKTPQFDDSLATFMDFSIPQKGNTRFMYVLPISKDKALFEYTLFSKDLLSFEEYEDVIKAYLKGKGINEFEITEKERGSIPMTSFKFSKLNTSNILKIGTAGGWTKASTGYTFRNTTKKTKALIKFLKHNEDLSKFHHNSKFWFYDLLFLDVLANHNDKGSKLFSSLFKKAKTKTILKFLDEETTFVEDLAIITSVPTKQFLKAFFKRLF